MRIDNNTTIIITCNASLNHFKCQKCKFQQDVQKCQNWLDLKFRTVIIFVMIHLTWRRFCMQQKCQNWLDLKF